MHSLRMNVPMLKHLPILVVYIFLTPLNYWLGGVILRLEAISARLKHSENDHMLRTPPIATLVGGFLRLLPLSVRLTHSENDPVLRSPPIFVVYISTPEVPSLKRLVF